MSEAASAHETPKLLAANGLVRHFRKPKRTPFSARAVVRAVEGVSFYIRPGETLGLVGESGCGKSTTGRMVIGIDQPTEGDVKFNDVDLSTLTKGDLQNLRRDIQMIFQDPLGALDPRIAVGTQIREPLDIHDIGPADGRDDAVQEMLAAVGMPPEMAARYPHELSGGQAQRIVIARALIVKPKLLVCDEPVSALDVSVQAQVIDLLADLQRKMGIAYLFISHDLKVVKHLSHRIAVMYLGQIVEQGPCDLVFEDPKHPYTKALISAIPNPDPTVKPSRILLSGDPPSPLSPPDGCRFHTRCQVAFERCSNEVPHFRDVGDARHAACHLLDGDDD
ncbi:MAG: ATP-binding cassette domain-containing protein [Rhodospirillales bacterium]|jgi:oligopeptide/dipeptide ABC transporter ATP-binding protein|nr:ATP-binding cassette domain-containing protein [Rhodospirillales bacterium]